MGEILAVRGGFAYAGCAIKCTISGNDDSTRLYIFGEVWRSLDKLENVIILHLGFLE